MNCEFNYCIYNKDFSCILEGISVNAYGICEDCIIVDIPYDDLESLKEAQLRQG